MEKVLKYKQVKEKFREMIERNISIEDIEDELKSMITLNPSDTLKYKKAFFSLIKDIDLELAVKYGEEVIKIEDDPKFMKVLAVRYKRLGQHAKYNAFVFKKIPMTIFKQELDEFIMKKASFTQIKEHIEYFVDSYQELELLANKVAFSKLKDTYTSEAVKYGEEVIKQEQDPKFIKVLASRYRKIGDLKRYESLNSLE